MDKETFYFRASVLREIRNFFYSRNYLESDVPLLSPDLIPETCLEVFKTDYITPDKKRSVPLYLVPSPEVYIKKLIAKIKESVFQISKCFRNVESIGNIHSPEFTMLEFYTVNANYKDSLKITQELFYHLLNTLFSHDNIPQDLAKPFLVISMEEAFVKYAGFSLKEAQSKESLLQKAKSIGLDPTEEYEWDDLYEMILVQTIEPSLPKDCPVLLIDYPVKVPCLAKETGDGFSRERWELYVRGIELANCYSEETNPLKVKEYFENEEKLKIANAIIPHKADEDYYKIFKDFPKCSGVAIGLDRLIAILLDKHSIEPVLPFPLDVTISK